MCIKIPTSSTFIQTTNMHAKILYFAIANLILLPTCMSSPKKYTPEDGFQPSHRYYESDLPTKRNNTYLKESKDSPDRLRFGLPVSTFGNTGSGVYGGNGNGNGNGVTYMMTPMKIDLGGVALGALIGLGAILIVPKLANIFTGGYGYRSLDGNMSSITEALARVDNSLQQHNIDSSSCMQRVICSYVHEAQINMANGGATTVDEIVYTLANNSLFSYMLDGSAVKQAVDMGKQGDVEKCAALYSKCPISRDNVMQIITNILPP